MYVPTHFAETRTDVLHALIRAHPLAALVTQSPDGLVANHLPFELDPDPAP
jgi:transcriptional regulator